MIIIAFAGIARSGKTTAANLVAEWAKDKNLNPVICSFAGPIKRAAAYLGITKDKDPVLYRKTLQRWGETRRNVSFRPGITGPHYWTNKVVEDIVKHAQAEKAHYRRLEGLGMSDLFKETILLFDDLRYLNELQLVQGLNGVVVYVDGARRQTDITAEWRQHESEALAMSYTFGLIPDGVFDYYVPNNTTEANFKSMVGDLASIWVDAEVLT